MKYKFSRTFITALISMSVITHSAQAQNQTPHTQNTKITCFHNGAKIIEESNLRDYKIDRDAVYLQRSDGTWVTVTGEDFTCLVETAQTDNS